MHTPEILTPPLSVDDDGIHPVARKTRSPLLFIVLIFALSVPFWVVGALTNRQLLPGIPVSALSLICPVTAAAILVHRAHGWAGVLAFLQRSRDFRRVNAKIWYLPTMLLMPGIMVLSYLVLRRMGVVLPDPQFSMTTTLLLSVVFFVAAIGEELGWSGYAIDPLQDRYGALAGALILGAVWVVWHVIPLLSVPRSPGWIAWWSLGTVAVRVIITWLYNNTGRSVFVAILFHAMINLTWQLFPGDGAAYDPRVTSVITALVACIVVIVYGPRTLVRAHNTRRSDATH